MELILKLIIFTPLASGLINGILYNKLSKKISCIIAIGAMSIITICTIPIFYRAGIKQEVIHVILGKWIKVDFFSANWSIYIDSLTISMMSLVSLVSIVVHIYSIGYMIKDDSLPKFLSYLSLFTFFMLVLVSSDNFLQLFFGWEGVGLFSYLLIGYYYTKTPANNAAIKAFIVNRIGDLMFIIGIIIIILHTRSVEFKSVFYSIESLLQINYKILGVNVTIVDLICFMLFLGCMTKSAQVGMHIWLPDAMEGPTPASALIHAATMVTSGVFLVARCSFIFEYSPLVLKFITIVGSITCLFASLVAVAQKDIKKIIAYSTCSQLGYMFFACGVSAYHAGIFHLITHGFFKALLFLSAGSIIHACHEQNLFKMGGLRKKLPITYINFCIGSFSLIGIFPFSGFYSKDLVLEFTYSAGGIGIFAFILGVISIVFTGIYSLKIIILTFHGKTKLTKTTFNSICESPKIMNLPLLLLLISTTFSGILGHYILNISDPNGFFINSIFNLHSIIQHIDNHMNYTIQFLPVVISIFSILLGIYIYNTRMSKKIAVQIKCLYYVFRGGFFIDKMFCQFFISTTNYLSKLLHICDIKIFDYLGPKSFSRAIYTFSRYICKVQTGYIFNYIAYIILSIVTYMTIFITKYLFTI